MTARGHSNVSGPDSATSNSTGQQQEPHQSAVVVDTAFSRRRSYTDEPSLLPEAAAAAEKVTALAVGSPTRRLSESIATSSTSSSSITSDMTSGPSNGELVASGVDDVNGPPGRGASHKRSKSLGAITSVVKQSTRSSLTADSSTAERHHQHHLTGLLQKLHLTGGSTRHAMDHQQEDRQRQERQDEDGPPPPPQGRRARETFHYRCFMDDSIAVQKRHNKVLDDEKHEENPHLEDYLHPHHFVHVEGQQSVLHTETRLLRVPHSPPAAAVVTAEEEDSIISDIDCGVDTGAASIKGEEQKSDGEESVAVLDVERVEVEDTPVTAVVHKTSGPLKSCLKMSRGQDEESPRKRNKKNVVFHEVTVRDYSIVLGGT